jgi:D-arabinose 1-dehydrogenase-like Zn-dependent alcohol dehydrogenase
MKAAIVPALNAPWEIREVPTPEPGPNQVLVKIHACGICGTDVWMTTGKVQFRQLPLAPGHEGVGEIVAVGEGATMRKVGDRVGVCTLQATCGHCDWCNLGKPQNFVSAANCKSPVLTGFNVDGGHAEYLLAYVGGTVLLPDGLAYEQAAPIMCAGYTVWSRLRRANPHPGERIAVVGIGGLGHLAVQYAKAAGFTPIAVTHTEDKKALAHELGADVAVPDGAALMAAGGADVILATGNSNAATIDAMKALRPNGRIIVMGVAYDALTIPNMGTGTGAELIMNSQQIIGSAHNGMEYLVEALNIAAQGKVKAMVEVYPKERVAEAYDRVASGKVRFRAVVTY